VALRAEGSESPDLRHLQFVFLGEPERAGNHIALLNDDLREREPNPAEAEGRARDSDAETNLVTMDVFLRDAEDGEPAGGLADDGEGSDGGEVLHGFVGCLVHL
jgi:hypothetical protein